MTRRRGRRRKKLLDDQGQERILSIEGGSSRSHYVEESFLEEALDLSFDRLLMIMNSATTLKGRDYMCSVSCNCELFYKFISLSQASPAAAQRQRRS